MTDDRIHAVLTAPQLARFRELCQLGDADLTTDFSGWNRHVILSPDSAFLFPRHQSSVPGLIREQAVLRSIQDHGTPAPRLLGAWQDDRISPYPFLRISRISGDPLGQHSPGSPGEGLTHCASLDQVLTVVGELGRAIATWHRVDINQLDKAVSDPTPDLNEFAAKFEPAVITAAACRAAAAAGLTSDHAREWVQILHPLAAMREVLVHGDPHQSQILIDEARKITGVIDWEHAGVGHPLKDFDFGEWGFGIFAWEEHFATIRQELWNSYRAARGDRSLPDWRTIHLYFSITELAYFSQESRNDPWTAQRKRHSRALVAQLEGVSASSHSSLSVIVDDRADQDHESPSCPQEIGRAGAAEACRVAKSSCWLSPRGRVEMMAARRPAQMDPNHQGVPQKHIERLGVPPILGGSLARTRHQSAALCAGSGRTR